MARTAPVRRPSGRLVGATCSALLLALTAGGTQMAAQNAAPKASPPNIVFILADDLGYGDIEPFGQTRIRTPNLARMAAEGTRFTQYYPGAAVCAATRSSLMTGQHTGHTRIRGNFSAIDHGRVPLLPEDVTIAEVLHGAGYATGIVGKWGLGEPGTTGEPRRQGFDFFYGFLNQRAAHTHYPATLWRNETEEVLPGNADHRRGTFALDRFTAEGLDFIERSHGRPFFLYLAYTVPHLEWIAPEDSLAEYRGKFPEVPYVSDADYCSQATPRAAYAAMITRMDRQIGDVFAALRRLGVANNTLVIFTSDNGAPSIGGVADFFHSNGPLRGYKNQLYEGGSRTPMIAWWPGVVPAGGTNTTPLAGWDMMETFAALSGGQAAAKGDGKSAVAALRGGPMPARDYFYWETGYGGFWQAVRIGDWKAVRPGVGQPMEVYDLAHDVGEKTNLASAHPEIVARAEQLFESAHVETPHWPRPLAPKARKAKKPRRAAAP